MCCSTRPACCSCGRRSNCHARSCATRAPCFSCGKRGSCHKRSCATRAPGYVATRPEPSNGNNTYGVDSASELDGPPAYEDVVRPNLTKSGSGGLWKFISTKYWAGRAGDEETVKALEYAFETGRQAGMREKL